MKTFLKDKKIKIPNTQVTIRSEARKEPNIIASGEIKTEIETDHIKEKKETKPLYKIHPSVRNLFKIHPQIKLPNVCLKYNITPCVSMPMDAVENYFKSHNLDFQKCTRLALRAGRVATKRTSSVAKPKNAAPSKAAVPSKVHKSEQSDKVTRIEVNEKVVNTLKIKLPLPSSLSDKVFHPEVQFNSNNSDNPIQNLEQASHKRKADVDKGDKKEIKKANFIESLGLTSRVPDQSGGTLPYVTNKSAPLHICEICNSVQYSAKDLRKHQNRHLRCQFCKTKFRSLESKKEHLDSKCSIKNMMNNLPEVKLKKIEFDLNVRRIYRKAFDDYPPLNGLIETSSITTGGEESVSAMQPVDSKDISANVVPEVTRNHQKETVELETSEVIEILSDEEEPITVPSGSNKEPLPINALIPPLHTPQTIPIPQIDNIVYNTVSIVRPEIKIKGSSALDMIDARLTDIKVLKELLTHYRPVHLYVAKNTQTEMPANESIFVNRPEMIAELKQLKPQLHVYKIPITMKPGIFNVTFNYNTKPKPPKKLCLWNDLNIIDIKTPVSKPGLKSASYDDANFQNKHILPSTATYNSTGVTTSKFIRVNASSLCPITTAPYSSPSNIININSLLNSTLQSTMASPAIATVSATSVEQASNAESPVTNAGQHFGTIRVKNVWELT